MFVFYRKSEKIQTLVRDQEVAGYQLKKKGNPIDTVKISKDLVAQLKQKIEERYKLIELKKNKSGAE